MTLNVFSTSDSFNQYIKKISEADVDCHTKLLVTTNINDIYLIHSPSIGKDYEVWVQKQGNRKSIICADRPNLVEMLSAVNAGAKAYCNSYMHEEHYQQMLRLVNDGQSWFPTQMLEETFKLASKVVNKENKELALDELTEKEKEISRAIAKGYSNQKIASQLKISESTVKTHLTHIYKKLDLKGRVGLILHMSNS